jgi:N-carbamoyl-L-amino-acid hydrolase
MPIADGSRVLADLHDLRRLGAYRSGVHRPSLSKEHAAALRWLVDRLGAIGHDARIDGIGNVLGFAPGQGPKLIAGSHLESQNHAGWLDGPLGVAYALEAARVVAAGPALAGSGAGVDVASWFDEEGHYGSFLGSRSFVGEVSEAEIDGAKDRTHGGALREGLAAAGLAGRPRLVLEPGRHLGYLEAHIEQGDWLEKDGLKLGIVTSIVGIHQYRITATGEQNHAGTTRMSARRDAGIAITRLSGAIERRFPEVAGERTVWTTGNITLEPGAPSIIPGRARMLFQFRDAEPARLAALDSAIKELVAGADRAGPCRLEIERLRATAPAVMDGRLQAALEAAAQRSAPGAHVRMPSGAGHDAQVLAQRMPAAMLFVPSIGGISHHWSEDTAEADIVLGAEVFVGACVALLQGGPT